MEAELRARGLPLVSLESQHAAGDFDVIGVSLQYELTFTNVLTMLELGGVPLRGADRSADAPLVIWPAARTASHPEPMAPFFDAAFIGEAEEQLPALARAWADMRRDPGRYRHAPRCAGRPGEARFALYVPALYATEVDERPA
jgi:radical SAM superfamily enzyme YgiQ (UPF0313 family)